MSNYEDVLVAAFREYEETKDKNKEDRLCGLCKGSG